MRGRPERRNNNAIPSEEIQLPCVLKWARCQPASCWHHVNRQCPDRGWCGAARQRAGRARSSGTPLLRRARRAALVTARRLDLDEFVWSRFFQFLLIAAAPAAHEATLIAVGKRDGFVLNFESPMCASWSRVRCSTTRAEMAERCGVYVFALQEKKRAILWSK